MNVRDWLLDSDPAIRWQVLRDLTNASADDVAAERARVEHEGWGARLLTLEDAENGRWEHAGQRYFDGEVEPCINGRTIETGAYFGVNVEPIVDRVLKERLEDGVGTAR